MESQVEFLEDTLDLLNEIKLEDKMELLIACLSLSEVNDPDAYDRIIRLASKHKQLKGFVINPKVAIRIGEVVYNSLHRVHRYKTVPSTVSLTFDDVAQLRLLLNSQGAVATNQKSLSKSRSFSDIVLPRSLLQLAMFLGMVCIVLGDCQVDNFNVTTGLDTCSNWNGTTHVVEFVKIGGDLWLPNSQKSWCQAHKAYSSYLNCSCVECEVLTGMDNCTGDDFYCAMRLQEEGSACNMNSSCTCNTLPIEEIPKVLAYSQWMTVEQVVNVTVGHERPINLFATTSSRSLKSRSVRQTVELQVVYATFTDPLLSITTTGTDTSKFYVLLQKTGWTSLENFTGRSWSKTIGPDQRKLSGPLYVSVTDENGQKIGEFTFDVVGVSSCEFHDCIMCWKVWNNWNCLPSTYKATVIMLWIVLSLLTLILVPYVFLFLFWAITSMCGVSRKLLCCCMAMPKTRFAKDAGKVSSKAVTKVHNYFLKVSDEEQMEAEDLEARSTTHGQTCRCAICIGKGKRVGGKMPFNMMTLVTFLGVISLASARTFNCQEGLFIPATFTNCVVSGTNQTCNVVFSLTSTIQSVTGASCFTLTDAQNRTFATGALVYTAMQDKIGLTTKYYTSKWEPASESTHRCHGFGQCTANNCASDFSNNRYAFGELTDFDSITWPGRTSCRRSCGCISCARCISCTPSCVFDAYGLVPYGSVYKVSTLNQRTMRPTLEIYIKDGQGKETSVFVNTIGSVTTVGSFRAQIVGSLAGDMTEFGNHKVMDDTQTAWLVVASDVNNPQQQTIGDIQASTFNAFGSANQNAFIHDPDIVIKSEQDTSTSFSFARSGALNRSLYPNFPLTLGGNLWSWSNGELISNITDPGALVVTLSTTSSFSVSRLVSLVCPTGLYVNGSGCYNCDIGFSIRINLYSTCADGIVTLTSQQTGITIFTNSLSITVTPTDYIVYGSTNVALNNFNLIVSANGGTLNLPVIFTAIEDVKLRNDTYTHQSKSGLEEFAADFSNFFTTDIPKFFDEIFHGKASWWQWIIFAVLIVIAAIIIFFSIRSTVLLYRGLLGSAAVRMRMVKKQQ